ncbi:MAG: hypothetical protein KDB23_02430 [Planctomycetales bacterium]|nr:hypothetical protein [Planctomycetales bacterium]
MATVEDGLLSIFANQDKDKVDLAVLQNAVDKSFNMILNDLIRQCCQIKLG